MGYPSGQFCTPSQPHKLRRGREAKGWVLHYCGGTLRQPLVVLTCTQVAMHLAQAFGSTSPHKREYLCTHGHICVCMHMGWGWGVENPRLPVTSPPGSQLSSSSCPTLAAPTLQRPGRGGGTLTRAWNWLQTASCKYVIWGSGWGGRDRNVH